MKIQECGEKGQWSRYIEDIPECKRHVKMSKEFWQMAKEFKLGRKENENNNGKHYCY